MFDYVYIHRVCYGYMHQLNLINSILSDNKSISFLVDSTKRLSNSQLQQLYKKVSLPFSVCFTGEFRKPNIGDYYLQFNNDAQDNGALNFFIKHAIEKISSKFLILKVLTFDARINNAFDINKCLNEDNGEAFFKGKLVTLLSNYVDSNLKVAVKKDKFIIVVDLMDLVNKEFHHLSLKMMEEDINFNNYTKWKTIN